MRRAGIHVKTTSWIGDFLGRRKLLLGSQNITIDNGLAQGSCLSPVLFNLYTATLHELNSESCILFQFADDFFIVVYDRKFEIARQTLEQKVLEFRNRCSDINLCFNLEKTSAIHFNRRRRPLDITLVGVTIEEVDKIKYLGLTIASNNSIRDHVERTLKDISRTSNFMKILCGCNFGIDPRKALTIYRAVIRPKIEYASSSLFNMGNTYIAKLKTRANEFIRRSLGLMRATPTPVLYHMAGELPINYRIQIATAKEVAKCFAYKLPAAATLNESPNITNTSYSKTYDDYKDIFKNIGYTEMTITISPNVKFYKDFFKGVVRRKQEASEEIVKAIYKEKLNNLIEDGFEVFFTDGSVCHNLSGAVFIHHDSGTVFSFYTYKNLSSMSAELMAIVKAVEYAANNHMLKIAILTDSQSSISAFGNPNINNFLASDFHRLADNIPAGVELHFVPGHSGIDMNEMVDQAARRPLEFGTCWKIAWPLQDAIRVLSEKISTKWADIYESEARGGNSSYYEINPTVSGSTWFDSLPIGALRCKSLNRILSGTCYCKSTLYKVCDVCLVEDTPTHILFECNKYLQQRQKFPELMLCDTIKQFVDEYGFTKLTIFCDFLAHLDLRL
ncbi:uncharacterized protein LOC142233510 [Haematobia irritans]|uniref:uncharacterized protein LOC142233510 n=1 Tax=Haematobia irritans TaxID=7368 RepID=UPI003F5016BF